MNKSKKSMTIVNRRDDNERKIIEQISIYLNDASADVRNQAKMSLREIVNLYDE